MGLDNPLHIAVLVVILLLVFGAKRLPELGRSLGSGMREFKDSVTGHSTPEQQTLPAAQQPVQPPAQAQPQAQPAPPQTPVAQPQAQPVPPQQAAVAQGAPGEAQQS
jgi:sec-independent protein translocase protein TatA